MRPLVSVLLLCFLVPLPIKTSAEKDALQTAGYIHTQDAEDNGDDMSDTEDDDYNEFNSTEMRGMFLGSPCDDTCNPNLHHTYCDQSTGTCECDKKYPVKLGPTKGCAKPKKLGEQCYYTHTCKYMDQHSSCIQVNHNAVCQCMAGYHLVTLQKPTKRIFCAEDLVLLTTNLSTLAGVFTGIAVLAGLICFVLRLFSQNHYERPRNFANANMPPPMLYASSDTGIQHSANRSGNRSTSRSSQRSGGTMISGYSRRPSSAQGVGSDGMIRGSRGVLVPSSRAGSRRPSLASVHSTGSLRSFGGRMLEREREQREQRQEIQARLARMASLPNSLPKVSTVPTPSPLSTDELLPSVCELREVNLSELNVRAALHGEIGPCSSKDCQ
ncbi:uncharacterized protein LOC123304988 [Chrysoperla carnea]|uniref:uncharacterized protein LOC123304988 n=1 Tax=Chrysoperla carnea TaxID=189513 RepID=UPI001D0875AE|nr:uncharacterized protein LOC123304988 [Chrysoperla carnea]